MVHKVFTNKTGDELSIFINSSNGLCIRIENLEYDEHSFIVLDLDDAHELLNELHNLTNKINDNNREPF